MPTSYSKFKIEDLEALSIKVRQTNFLNGHIDLVEPSDYLKTTITKNLKKPMLSEKAKSEYLISPILSEIQERNIEFTQLFSGYTFDVDKEKGLKGLCDFIFTFALDTPIIITSPVFSIVEAKNDNLSNGIPQCIAELYAADIFNERHGKKLPTLFGATTFGLQWQFIRYSNKFAEVDSTVYYINQLPQILGILQYIVDTQKKNWI
jgi:hypothetical protein